MIGKSPVCLQCAHFHENLAVNDLPGAVCDAFPQGIPKEIMMAGDKHDKPIKGDHGIQFEKNTGNKGATLSNVVALKSRA